MDSDSIDNITNALQHSGYIVLSDVFTPTQVETALNALKAIEPEGFRQAGIGRKNSHQINTTVRSDHIHWLEHRPEGLDFYFAWCEKLRLALNRQLYMGIDSHECHFSRYAPGAFYRRHIDAFRGRSSRLVSSILYLNHDWQPEDGGELVLYTPGSDDVLERIQPGAGCMVLFLSEDFPHEVLPAKRTRYSLTGWFRTGSPEGGH